jgi:hypothetical protein
MVTSGTYLPTIYNFYEDAYLACFSGHDHRNFNVHLTGGFLDFFASRLKK